MNKRYNKRGLIIINSFALQKDNRYKIDRLIEEFKRYDIIIDVKDSIQLSPVCIGDDTFINGLDEYDFAIDLDKDIYVAQALSSKIRMFNRADAILKSDDKMLTLLALKDTGIKTPKTISFPLCYTTDINDVVIDSFLDRVEKELFYPLVFKKNHGSMGRQVSLIKNREELYKIYLENRFDQCMFEEFLKAHIGQDYRLIMIGDRCIAAMSRTNKNDFRSNIALGGIGKDVTDSIPEEFKITAIKACKALGLDYAGIDLSEDESGHPIFIEANCNAFFTEIERVTKINIAKAFVDYIVRQVLL